jgi:hypothetical protein
LLTGVLNSKYPIPTPRRNVKEANRAINCFINNKQNIARTAISVNNSKKPTFDGKVVFFVGSINCFWWG